MSSGYSVFQFSPPSGVALQDNRLVDQEQRARRTHTAYQGRVFPETYYAEATSRRTLIPTSNGGGSQLYAPDPEVSVELMVPDGRQIAVQVVGYWPEGTTASSCVASNIWPRMGFLTEGINPVTGSSHFGTFAFWNKAGDPGPNWYTTTGAWVQLNSTVPQPIAKLREGGGFAHMNPNVPSNINYFNAQGNNVLWTVTAVHAFGTGNLAHDLTCGDDDGKIHLDGLRMWVHLM